MKTNFNERLRKAMDSREISQTELSKKTKIRKDAISRYLSGNYEPKLDRVAIIAKVLNVNPSYLMGFNVPMDKESDEHKKIRENISERCLNASFDELTKVKNYMDDIGINKEDKNGNM